MATDAGYDSGSNVFMIAAVAALAFAGGYFYYHEKDKNTVFDIRFGDREISAEIEH
ncbi:MAG: hypothetical protein IT558_03330 [Alphaproteobacteria bacterium]|nr:hypothetical protein [Alphaproteobacteria bacterium]